MQPPRSRHAAAIQSTSKHATFAQRSLCIFSYDFVHCEPWRFWKVRAVGFGIYESAKPLAAENGYLRDRPALAKVVCGYAAGLLSETIVYPLDTVRRRQQALGSGHPIGRLGIVAAVLRIYAHEGTAGLFKGISLNLIKNPAATSISFTINDIVKDALGYGADAPAPPGKPDGLNRTLTQAPGGLAAEEKDAGAGR